MSPIHARVTDVTARLKAAEARRDQLDDEIEELEAEQTALQAFGPAEFRQMAAGLAWDEIPTPVQKARRS